MHINIYAKNGNLIKTIKPTSFELEVMKDFTFLQLFTRFKREWVTEEELATIGSVELNFTGEIEEWKKD